MGARSGGYGEPCERRRAEVWSCRVKDASGTFPGWGDFVTTKGLTFQ